MAAEFRVLYVIECGGPGGAGNQTAALCRGLDKEKFEVHLAYAVRPGAAAADYEKLCAGAACHHLPRMGREISPLNDLLALAQLWALMRRLRPDIVHGQSSKGGFLARVAALLAGVPRIYYSPRGYGFLQTDRSRLSRALYRLLETAVSGIGSVAAVSRSEAALARSLPTTRAVAVVDDAYLGALPELPARDGRRVVTVCASGRLAFARRPEAFGRLARALTRFPQARFVWIGDGELRGRLEQLRRAYRLENVFEITGWLEPEAVSRRLLAADVFVHYSRWEGLPNAVLEAMAHGLPVAASDIDGNRNVVRPGENGYLAASEAELAARVGDLIAAPERRAAFGAAGRALIENRFLAPRMIAQTQALYLAERCPENPLPPIPRAASSPDSHLNK